MQDTTEKISSVTAAIDYNSTEPCIIQETAHWAVVYKPPHLPTAPLRSEERNTLVYWFLHRQVDNKPEIQVAGQRIREAQVRGKKAIEAGLLHRLDTDTRGLVLFAKDQGAYDFLAARQEAGQIIKTYWAFVEPYDSVRTICGASNSPETRWSPNPPRTAMVIIEAIFRLCRNSLSSNVQRWIALGDSCRSYTLESQFRNFGPGAKRVAPVFPGSRYYKKDGRLYTTMIEAVDILPSLSLFRVRCRLSRGYRHQVRAHLAAAGLPIAGDPLYAPQGAEAAPVSLQLYAVSLEFPDPENPRQNIRVALPPPDKMNP